MPSFGGINFEERGQSAQTFPQVAREADYTVLTIPGGGSIVQIGGAKPATMSLQIRCTKSQLESLVGAVGTTATLSYSYGSLTALLAGVQDSQEVLVSGKYFATLNFIEV